MVWGPYLHCRGQVDDKAIMELGTMLAPSSLDILAQSHSEVDVSLRECFWAVLVPELGSVLDTILVGELPYEIGMLYGQSDALLL